MFRLIKIIFMGLLISIVNASNHINLSPTLIYLHPNEYSQEFYHYPFAVKLDRCVRSCNTLMTYLIKYVFQIKQKV